MKSAMNETTQKTIEEGPEWLVFEKNEAAINYRVRWRNVISPLAVIDEEMLSGDDELKKKRRGEASLVGGRLYLKSESLIQGTCGNPRTGRRDDEWERCDRIDRGKEY